MSASSVLNGWSLAALPARIPYVFSFSTSSNRLTVMDSLAEFVLANQRPLIIDRAANYDMNNTHMYMNVHVNKYIRINIINN
uniref:Uncharacterized protein n=1 Tax=Oryza nivara TaxID=4536 RepID=A0A0E0J0C2_ORYNI